MRAIYIGDVQISEAMASKIASKHGVTADEVREACQAPASPLSARWDDHPEHGRRLLVIGRTVAGRILKVILQPVDVSDGTWRLRTAFAVGRTEG